MKKILALLLVLVITACMTSCDLLSGIFGGDGGNSGDGGNGGGGQTEEEKDPVIEEDDGDVDSENNIDPDNWIGIPK